MARVLLFDREEATTGFRGLPVAALTTEDNMEILNTWMKERNITLGDRYYISKEKEIYGDIFSYYSSWID